MESTYNIKAIILKREPFREYDGRVTVFSREAGKQCLVVRGMKKIQSKLAGHLEPLTLTDIMAVRGRHFDYVGAAASEDCFPGIKNDLEKISRAGQAAKMFNRLVKEDERDENIFDLLLDFLKLTDQSERKSGLVFFNLFTFKLLSALGYRPELKKCVVCGEKLKPGNNVFNAEKGGVVCGSHANTHGASSGEITDNCVKLLRLAGEKNLTELAKIKMDNWEKEMDMVVSCFAGYCVY